jgi:hypothetical protein
MHKEKGEMENIERMETYAEIIAQDLLSQELDTLLPVINDPVPFVEDPVPFVEDPVPFVEDPVPFVEDPVPFVDDPVPFVEDPILSVTDLERYKSEAILARDRFVTIINDISSYRVLNHQYLPITRPFIREIEARDFTDTDRLKSLPQSFAFVMALHNKECRKMSNAEILSNFFGEDCYVWINVPEKVSDFSDEKQTQIYANYEYMAYIVLNACDELAFSIQSGALHP